MLDTKALEDDRNSRAVLEDRVRQGLDRLSISLLGAFHCRELLLDLLFVGRNNNVSSLNVVPYLLCVCGERNKASSISVSNSYPVA